MSELLFIYFLLQFRKIKQFETALAIRDIIFLSVFFFSIS